MTIFAMNMGVNNLYLLTDYYNKAEKIGELISNWKQLMKHIKKMTNARQYTF